MRALFITWDAPEASYLESLFLPIFEGLAVHGIAFDVLQFRWGDRALTRRTAELCHARGIGYRSTPILRALGGLGAMASAVLGGFAVRRAVHYFGSDILMPRSLMPALATLAAGDERFRPIVFDADGLAADERVEFAGLPPTGLTYRLLRDIEAQMVRRSASVIVRSQRAADILQNRAGPTVSAGCFHVVTNGRDETRFAPGNDAERLKLRQELGYTATDPVIVYAGSVGQQYRFDRLCRFVDAVLDRRPDTRLLILSGASNEARALLAQSSARVARAAFATAVSPLDVPRYLACADVGTAFRQPSFSMSAVAPIKIAEYLLCGLPVVGTGAIGDNQIAMEAGAFFDEAEGLDAAADWFINHVLPAREQTRTRARNIGVEAFSLARSVKDYHRAFLNQMR